MIVKPEASSQGKGIYITKRLEDVHTNEHCVVQKYMRNPLLIDGFKFDLRIYVMITSWDPLKIFIYKEGMARFATDKYDVNSGSNNYQNMFMHLTNYAINKLSDKFELPDECNQDTGHKRLQSVVFKRMESEGVDIDKVNSQIEDIIVKTLISIQPELKHNYRTWQPSDYEASMCFEILGFDIFIDKKNRPWLLEVNLAPSFNEDSNVDREIKYNLLLDSFRLLGVSHNEKLRKTKRREEFHNRIIQRISFKEKMQKHQEEMEVLKAKRKKFEDNNMGNYKRIYPSQSDTKQRIFDKYLDSFKNQANKQSNANSKFNAPKKDQIYRITKPSVSHKDKPVPSYDHKLIKLSDSVRKQQIKRTAFAQNVIYRRKLRDMNKDVNSKTLNISKVRTSQMESDIRKTLQGTFVINEIEETDRNYLNRSIKDYIADSNTVHDEEQTSNQQLPQIEKPTFFLGHKRGSKSSMDQK